MGGDPRLALDPLSGLNKYACRPFPDPELLAFGSSTASVISPEGFAIAERLRRRLSADMRNKTHATVYALEMQRMRSAWLQSCGLAEIDGLELIFSPSGTDAHGIAAQYAGSGAPALIIMVEANETGSGVASALNVNNVEVAHIAIRLDDGTPRPLAAVDAEAEALASQAVASNRRVLLILVDQSKTGLIAPSPACVTALQQRFPDRIEVLVDACQFRIAAPTLRAYLEQDFMVALTGSKFFGAPSFSAALLVPPNAAKRLQNRVFPKALPAASAGADWPEHWPGAEHIDHTANFGLLLRCAVAADELKRFSAAPQAAVVDFLQRFAQAISQRLLSDPHFEALPCPRIDRRPLVEAASWDQLPTIFPFLLYDPDRRRLLNREQTLLVYQRLPAALDRPGTAIRCQLGQPVACGVRNGTAVSALRLCLSSRLLVEATHADKAETVINNALAALDKTALLIGQLK